MMRPNGKGCVLGFLIASSAIAIAVSSGGCSAAKNAVANIEGVASGCEEFNGGASSVSSLSIDGDTKAFVVASANLVSVATTAEGDVLKACIAIDQDLGVTDTWSAKAPSKGAPDDEVTEACHQAATKIS